MPQGPGTYGSKKGRPKKKKSLRSKAKGLVEKINPFDKESKSKRAYKKRVKSASFVGPKRKKVSKVSKLKSAVGSMTNKGRAKKIGAAKGTKVSKGAVGVEKTKGGDFVKYKKDSKAAGSFRSAFKKSCSGDAKGFTWQGRKYSCAKK